MTTKAYKSLEFMLSFTEKDGAEEMTDKLTKRYGSLYAILTADNNMLVSDEGVSAKSAKLFTTLMAIASRRGTDRLKLGKPVSNEDVDGYFKSLFTGVCVEKFYLMSFDASGAPIGVDRICEGTVNATEIIPRKIVDIAVRRRARSVIVAHNHPGGVAKPSLEDVGVTATLSRVLTSSGIDLLRHVIIAGHTAASVYPDE